MYLKNAIFRNIAPFNNLDLSFNKNEIIILTGINGKGKTTILSYIADAFFEIAKIAGYTDLLDDQTKFYRVTSQTHSLNPAQISIVYLRFENEDGINIDFIEITDIQDIQDKAKYDELITLDNKIEHNLLVNKFSNTKMGKFVHIHSKGTEIAKSVFEKNVLTYFPFDRSELPLWMNDTEYKIHRFNTKSRFSRQLNKNIESKTIAADVANWVLDVVLDQNVSIKADKFGQVKVNDTYSQSILFSLNQILQIVLSHKTDKCRFGVTPRRSGQTRIGIYSDDLNGITKQITPSIFQLSSGEISLLMLFNEILRQYDQYPKKSQFQFSDVTGIVVADEIDKHLHIKLQREVLPNLIKLFPKVQFIASSHSPFFALGTEEVNPHRTRLVDISIGGKDVPAISTDETKELYQSILTGNENYRLLYNQLESEVAITKKLRILTEGHNTKYLKKAIELIEPNLMKDIFICDGAESITGKNQLITFYNISVKTNLLKILTVFDCDAENETKKLIESDLVFKFTFTKNLENTKVNKGIENLFDFGKFTEKYYYLKTEQTGCGGVGNTTLLDKNKFLNDMIATGTIDDFKLFKPLIEKIRSIIQD